MGMACEETCSNNYSERHEFTVDVTLRLPGCRALVQNLDANRVHRDPLAAGIDSALDLGFFP